VRRDAADNAAAAAGRIMPNNREAEEGVLGGILIDNRVLPVVIEQLQPEDFYVEAHQKIYEAMLALSEASQPIDIITLADRLGEGDGLEALGGSAYLASLIDATPTTANITHHARIVQEKAVVRRAIYAAKEIASRGMGDYGEVEEFLDEAEKKVFDVARARQSSPYVHVGPIVHEVFQSIGSAAEADGKITGIPTGFADLDEMTAGLQPGDLIIIAGRPSMGKTAFCLNVATGAAMREFKGHNCGVLFLSLEMGREQLVRRMMCCEGRVDASKVRVGAVGHDDWPRLIEAANFLSQAPIYIDDTPAITVLEARAKARRLMSEHGVDVIMVDYLQLMRASGKAASESREREISEISRSLKALAKELNVPVIALSQLNRALEQRQDKRPIMADLRESGAIEQDADVILFIYRDEVYNKETPDVGIAEIIIAKQRNGPVGKVRLRFAHEFTRFDSLTRRDAAEFS
jgi:replicative DNA helicase